MEESVVVAGRPMGKLAGIYSWVRLLGQGTSAQVWLVEDDQSTEYAVKAFRPESRLEYNAVSID